MRYKKWLPYVVYTLVALAVMAPWLRPGFILTMDMAFTPNMPLPNYVGNTYLFYAMLHFAHLLIPAEVLQKILLFAVLYGAGLGAHRLCLSFWPRVQREGAWLPYVAGSLFAINPFVYTRLMAGHYLVLLGYALLPFVLAALLAFWRDPTWRRAAKVVGWSVAVSIVSIHALGFVVLLGGVLGMLTAWQQRHHRQYLQQLVVKCGAIVLGFVGLSAYWLLPTLRGTSQLAHTVTSFTAADTQAFVTVGGSLVGRLVNVLSLQGFWQDSRELYTLPHEQLPFCALGVGVLWLLVGVGFVALWQQRRFHAAMWAVVLVLAACIAAGLGHNWMVAHIPFFGGYREPQKFVALIALCYAVLVPGGLAWLAKKWQDHRPTLHALLPGALLLPIVLAPSLLWGCAGQLSPHRYPESWEQVNKYLQEHAAQATSLFLPWHQYMAFGFAERIIANPAPSFFTSTVVSSSDPELAGVQPDVAATPLQTLGRQLAPDAVHSPLLGHALAAEQVKYIVVAKEFEFAKYDYLNQQPYLKKVMDTPNMVVYRNTAFKETP